MELENGNCWEAGNGRRGLGWGGRCRDWMGKYGGGGRLLSGRYSKYFGEPVLSSSCQRFHINMQKYC